MTIEKVQKGLKDYLETKRQTVWQILAHFQMQGMLEDRKILCKTSTAWVAMTTLIVCLN